MYRPKRKFLGFVFYEKSPRNISLSDIEILSKYNKKNSAFVAVTVNPSDDFIKNLIEILIIFNFMDLKQKIE